MVLENAFAAGGAFRVPPQTRLIISLLLSSRWQCTSFCLIYKYKGLFFFVFLTKLLIEYR